MTVYKNSKYDGCNLSAMTARELEVWTNDIFALESYFVKVDGGLKPSSCRHALTCRTMMSNCSIRIRY